MERIKPRTLSGFMELLPAPQTQFERMLEKLRTTYSLYGFTPLDTPIIESAEILLAKGGGETEKHFSSHHNIGGYTHGTHQTPDVIRFYGTAACPADAV